MLMRAAAFPPVFELSDRDLSVIARIVYDQAGISLHAGKRALVAARLQKRLRQGGFQSFRQYLRHLQSDESGAELTAMLDALATNHTSFFREPGHFEFLVRTVLPPLVARRGPIHGWSAACSTGEEAYTIAMVLLEHLGAAAGGFRVLASDISTKALAVGVGGVYPLARLRDVPHVYGRYLMTRGDSVGVAPVVRRAVEFRRLNLLRLENAVPPQDFIFCRNVMIYFDRDAQQRVVAALEGCLARGGYLFVSHSESLSRVSHGLTWVAPAVYRKGPA